MKQTDRGLENTHLSDVQDYLKEHADSIMRSDRPFSKYMRAVIRKKGLKHRDVFLWADIPERYGYKLTSEEKRTRQRDVILRICYAAEFTLDEVIKAHNDGNPILLSCGMGTTDGSVVAPFVFDAANENEHSLGYVEELDNDDGCIRLVYDLEKYGDNAGYTTFANVAYVYVCE